MKTNIIFSILVLSVLGASSPALAQESSNSNSALCQWRLQLLKHEGQDALAEIRKLQLEKDHPSRENSYRDTKLGALYGIIISAGVCASFKSCKFLSYEFGSYATVMTGSAAALGGYGGSLQDRDRISNVNQELACLKSNFGEAVSNNGPKSATASSAKVDGPLMEYGMGMKGDSIPSWMSGMGMYGSTTQQAK